MKDLIKKGTGNSRLLKTSLAEGTSWEAALAMLRAGTFPIDLAGINADGVTEEGTPLNKANILPDTLVALMGLTQDNPTIKDALTALQNLAKNANTLAAAALPKSGGTMTGNLVLKGNPTANLQAATKQYVDNSTTPAVLHVLVGSGNTVTATRNGKTLSAIAGSDGFATLYPAEFGDWTVKCGTASQVFYINAIAEFYMSLATLKSLDWGTIASVSQAGLASKLWNVGDIKQLTVDGVNYTAVIIGFDHDTLSTGGKAGITWQLQNCLATTYPMNSSNTNSGGWKNSVMRTSTMATLLNQLPTALKNVIKAVNKLSSAGSQSNTIETTSDKLFLLSEVEIFGGTTYSKAGEGQQYDYYKAGNPKVKTVNGSAYHWWERSPYGSNSTYFCLVHGSGSANDGDASSSYGVSFGFCI